MFDVFWVLFGVVLGGGFWPQVSTVCVCVCARARARVASYTLRQARSPNPCCNGKGRSVTYSDCVSVALVIQHYIHIMSPVTCPTVPIFSRF